MAQTAHHQLFPGTEYAEKSWDVASQDIVGGASDICGVILIAQKGPINTPTYITSWDQFVKTFGSYLADANGAYSVREFFNNRGGSGKLYVVRVVHYGDVSDPTSLTATMAKTEINDRRATGAVKTVTFYDKYYGALGNTYGIKITDEHRVSSYLTDDAASGATQIEVKIVRNFIVGDYVSITKTVDGTPVVFTSQITAIDPATRKLTLKDALTSAFTENCIVNTADFTVEVYYKTATDEILEKKFVGCNMDPESAYYIENQVNSDRKGSSLVSVVDEQINVSTPPEKNPKILSTIQYLTGGGDGLTNFADTDIIGSAEGKTGLYAFESVTDMIHVWCPESSSMAVNRAGFSYWENRMTGMFFGSVPSGLNPEDAADYRDQAAWDTSYGALYHNWGYVDDPIGTGDKPQKLIPLVGHVLGAMGKNDETHTEGYGSAPAGEKMTLVGVNSLEFDVDSSNGGVMYGENNRNINPIIRAKKSDLTFGIMVWGSRTQSSAKKWTQIHARRIFIYVETNIVAQTKWIAFENKGDALYNRISRIVSKFLRSVKGLAGNTDAERFQFVCDNTINNDEDSVVNSQVALNISAIGEFVWFEFGHTPDTSTLSES